MVLVGLDDLVGAYREVNDYQFVLDQTVDHNPDELSAEELHEAAWSIVAERFAQSKHSAVERFGELRGTGQTSVDPAEIETAAGQGRVESLFLAEEPSCWDQKANDSSGAISIGADSTATRIRTRPTAARRPHASQSSWARSTMPWPIPPAIAPARV